MHSFGRFVTWVMLLGACYCIQYSNGERCPPPSWVKPTRTCISDKECYPALCCLDYQGRKSCASSQSGHRLSSGKGKVSNVNCKGAKCRLSRSAREIPSRDADFVNDSSDERGVKDLLD